MGRSRRFDRKRVPASIAGLRPTRHDRPTRLLAILLLYSAPVGAAGVILLSDAWMARLRGSFDPEGITLAFTLGIVSVGGAVVLIPAWGYAMGRTFNWARSEENVGTRE
jgi:hypothetical protein